MIVTERGRWRRSKAAADMKLGPFRPTGSGCLTLKTQVSFKELKLGHGKLMLSLL